MRGAKRALPLRRGGSWQMAEAATITADSAHSKRPRPHFPLACATVPPRLVCCLHGCCINALVTHVVRCAGLHRFESCVMIIFLNVPSVDLVTFWRYLGLSGRREDEKQAGES